MIRFSRATFEAIAPNRPPGYREAVLARAKGNGSVLELTPADYQEIRRAFPVVKKFGLGDAVAILAQPIAGVLDAVTGSHLKECGGCKARREALNRAVPNVLRPFSTPSP